jgi:hypothetical protein
MNDVDVATPTTDPEPADELLRRTPSIPTRRIADDAPPRWLSRRQTVAHLGISENTLDRLIARKEIRSFLLGSKRIIPLREIEAYEARKLHEADPAY